MPQLHPFAWFFTILGIAIIATIAFFYVKDNQDDIAKDSIAKMWGKYPLDSWIVKLNTLKKWIGLAFWMRYVLVVFSVHSAFMILDYSSDYHEDILKLESVPGKESGHKTLYNTKNGTFSLIGANANKGEYAIVRSSWWFSVPRFVSFEGDTYTLEYPTRRNLHNFIILPIFVLIISSVSFFMKRGRYHLLYAGLTASAVLEASYLSIIVFYCV